MKKETFNKITDYLTSIIKGTEFYSHVFAVGGCCRDYLSDRDIKDIDLVVSIPDGGIKFAQWLESNGYTKGSVVVYPHFGTAMFHLKEFPEHEIEAVQTRKEAYRDVDTRNPETAFGTIKEDCTRRDFTYNAIYHPLTETGGMLDFNGNSLKDLDDNILRTCGDPNVIFTEDPLRILRAVRFAARFGSTIEDETFECAKKYVNRLEIISKERIHDEFAKMCDVNDFWRLRKAICLLWDLGAFPYILPSLSVKHFEDGVFFLNDIYEFYKINVKASLEELFACFLYDSPDAEKEMRELKCDNEFIRNVMFYINMAKKCLKEVDYDTFGENEEYHFRRWMNLCGSARKLQVVLSIDPELRDMYFDTYDFEDSLFNDMEDGNLEYYTYKLPVNGEDVMEVLGIKPGPEVKSTLDALMNFAYINKDFKDEKSIRDYLKYIRDTRPKA